MCNRSRINFRYQGLLVCFFVWACGMLVALLLGDAMLLGALGVLAWSPQSPQPLVPLGPWPWPLGP